MEEAGKIHAQYTPRGWMKTEKELLKFEQHLYMRQPGYGTSYITGKHLIDEAMAEIVRLRRFLLTIRDAGMTADDAAEHAAFALMPEGARHRAWE